MNENNFLKPKLQYRGKYYDEQEFWHIVKGFTNRKTTDQDFYNLFDEMKHEIWTNIRLTETKLTNAELRVILEEIFVYSLEKFLRKEKIVENKIESINKCEKCRTS